MAHCPPEQLGDLADVLAALRCWEGVSEAKPGIFYLGRTPFLHFHLKDGRRWADARDGADWGEPIEIPLGSRPRQRAAFLATVSAYYRNTARAVGAKRPAPQKSALKRR